jgi:hypothetical protein
MCWPATTDCRASCFILSIAANPAVARGLGGPAWVIRNTALASGIIGSGRPPGIRAWPAMMTIDFTGMPVTAAITSACVLFCISGLYTLADDRPGFVNVHRG